MRRITSQKQARKIPATELVPNQSYRLASIGPTLIGELIRYNPSVVPFLTVSQNGTGMTVTLPHQGSHSISQVTPHGNNSRTVWIIHTRKTHQDPEVLTNTVTDLERYVVAENIDDVTAELIEMFRHEI